MNRRQMNHLDFRLAVLGIVFALAPGSAHAQPALTTRPATAPASTPAGVAPNNALKTSPTLTPAQTTAVQQFVKASAARLVNLDDPDGAATARTELVGASATGSSQTPPTVAYLTVFLPALNTELKALADNPSMRVKLNAGIVASRVMANVKDVIPPTALLNTAQTLMNDPSDAVALWGVKAAGNILNAPGVTPNPALLKQVAATVDKHNLNGPITDEAYAALQALDPQVIATLIQLYAKRIEAYKTALPPDPDVDHRPSSYLVAQTGMWKAMTPQQQGQVANLISQLLTHADAAINSANVAPEMISQLRSVIIETAKATAVIGTNIGDSALNLNSMKLTRATSIPPAQITPLVQAVVADLQRVFPPSPAANIAKP